MEETPKRKQVVSYSLDSHMDPSTLFYPIKESESFNYKTKLVGKLLATVNNRAELEDIKIVIPLKQLFLV